MGSRLVLTVALWGVVAGAACSTSKGTGPSLEGDSGGPSEDSSAPGSSGGSSSGSPDGSATGSSSGASDASAASEASVDAGAPLGWVFLTENKNLINVAHDYWLNAEFPRPAQGVGVSLCDVGKKIGSCCLWNSNQPLPDSGAPPAYVSAGDITLRDMATTLATATFLATASTGYKPLTTENTPSLVWAAGDTLSVSGVGASVAAFSGAVVAPALFANLTPPFTAPVTLSAGWTLTWTPDTASGGTVTVTFSDSLGEQVGCTVPDSAGKVIIPSSVLSNFGTGMHYVLLSRLRVARTSDGEVEIHAIAQIQAQVTFQ